MHKFTIMELFLLAITIFGATNMMALQGALAQNSYYFIKPMQIIISLQ